MNSVLLVHKQLLDILSCPSSVLCNITRMGPALGGKKLVLRCERTISQCLMTLTKHPFFSLKLIVKYFPLVKFSKAQMSGYTLTVNTNFDHIKHT